MRFIACSIALAALFVAPATAQEDVRVDLQLVLAVDVSLSMDVVEQRVQRRGYIDAFRHDEVIAAILSGSTGRIALTYLEWSESGTETIVVPWRLIDAPEAAEDFAAELEAAPITRWRATSISAALHYAAGLFDGSGFTGGPRVIDISGDGPNNIGGPVAPVRDAVIERGITINGLPIMTRHNVEYDFLIPNMDIYYRDCVIGGPNAFLVAVEETAQFAEAIRKKLVLEIAARPVLPVVEVAHPDTADCLIGEKMQRRPTP